MTIVSAPLNKDGKNRELADRGYLVLDSSSTDFHGLAGKSPMILDSGVVVFVCLGGRGKIIVDMNTIDIQRGSFVLLVPYSVIQIVEASDDIKITLVATGMGFPEKFLLSQPIEGYIARIREEPCLQLNEQQLLEVKNIFGFVVKQCEEANGTLSLEIRTALMTFLALKIISTYAVSQAVSKRKKISRHEQLFRNFTLSLSKNIREYRTVEFYAGEAYLTAKHFSTVIKKRSGKLPSEWITEKTITLIKFLLDNTRMSIQEIANELNFANQSFFTQYFKNVTGLTPTEYRKQEK